MCLCVKWQTSRVSLFLSHLGGRRCLPARGRGDQREKVPSLSLSLCVVFSLSLSATHTHSLLSLSLPYERERGSARSFPLCFPSPLPCPLPRYPSPPSPHPSRVVVTAIGSPRVLGGPRASGARNAAAEAANAGASFFAGREGGLCLFARCASNGGGGGGGGESRLSLLAARSPEEGLKVLSAFSSSPPSAFKGGKQFVEDMK